MSNQFGIRTTSIEQAVQTAATRVQNGKKDGHIYQIHSGDGSVVGYAVLTKQEAKTQNAVLVPFKEIARQYSTAVNEKDVPINEHFLNNLSVLLEKSSIQKIILSFSRYISTSKTEDDNVKEIGFDKSSGTFSTMNSEQRKSLVDQKLDTFLRNIGDGRDIEGGSTKFVKDIEKDVARNPSEKHAVRKELNDLGMVQNQIQNHLKNENLSDQSKNGLKKISDKLEQLTAKKMNEAVEEISKGKIEDLTEKGPLVEDLAKRPESKHLSTENKDQLESISTKIKEEQKSSNAANNILDDCLLLPEFRTIDFSSKVVKDFVSDDTNKNLIFGGFSNKNEEEKEQITNTLLNASMSDRNVLNLLLVGTSDQPSPFNSFLSEKCKNGQYQDANIDTPAHMENIHNVLVSSASVRSFTIEQAQDLFSSVMPIVEENQNITDGRVEEQNGGLVAKYQEMKDGPEKAHLHEKIVLHDSVLESTRELQNKLVEVSDMTEDEFAGKAEEVQGAVNKLACAVESSLLNLFSFEISSPPLSA